jgi:hypothetical protein
MTFNQLLQELRNDFPDIAFKQADHFAWSSKNSQISYLNPTKANQENEFCNKLLHELAHAKLGHQDYSSDAELLKIESGAWGLAKVLAVEYSIQFDEDEQERSMESYISWASSRSQCPRCKKNGLQSSQTEFLCPACSHKWNVGRSRFTRTYRH